jgi:hypothetical protein
VTNEGFGCFGGISSLKSEAKIRLLKEKIGKGCVQKKRSIQKQNKKKEKNFEEKLQ